MVFVPKRNLFWVPISAAEERPITYAFYERSEDPRFGGEMFHFGTKAPRSLLRGEIGGFMRKIVPFWKSGGLTVPDPSMSTPYSRADRGQMAQ